MRNLLIGLLLAGAAATPALAQDNGDHRGHHDQQQTNRGDGHQHQQAQPPQGQPQAPQQNGRGPRSNGYNGEGRQRSQWSAGEQPQVQVQQGQRVGWDRGRFEGRATNVPQGTPQQVLGYRGDQGSRDHAQGWTRDGYRGQIVPQQGPGGYYGQRGTADPRYSDGNGQRQWNGDRGQWDRSGDQRREAWNRDWRRDDRYDWRRYRDSHRSVFQLGIYIDPFGYNYRPYSVGYRLPPIYFGQQYWIDPGMFDLPFAPPGTRWVRYWNDALLVDVYTGQVVDVIQGFFW